MRGHELAMHTHAHTDLSTLISHATHAWARASDAHTRAHRPFHIDFTRGGAESLAVKLHEHIVGQCKFDFGELPDASAVRKLPCARK